MATFPPINSTHSLLSIPVRVFFICFTSTFFDLTHSLWQFSPSFKPWPPTRTCRSPEVPLACRGRRSSSFCASCPPHRISRHTINPAHGNNPQKENSFGNGYRTASMRTTPRLSQLPGCYPPSGHVSKSPSAPTKASLKPPLCSRRTWDLRLSPGQHGHQMSAQSCKPLFAALSRFLATLLWKTGPCNLIANYGRGGTGITLSASPRSFPRHYTLSWRTPFPTMEVHLRRHTGFSGPYSPARYLRANTGRWLKSGHLYGTFLNHYINDLTQ